MRLRQGPRQPAVELGGGLAGRRAEDRPQPLLQQVAAPQRGADVAREAGVQEQGSGGPAHRELVARPRAGAGLSPWEPKL